MGVVPSRSTGRSMPSHSWRSDPSRVLALVTHYDYPGLAVLDRWGLLTRRIHRPPPTGGPPRPPGFMTWDLAAYTRVSDRAAAFLDRLDVAVRRYRPTHVVLAVPTRADPRHHMFCDL